MPDMDGDGAWDNDPYSENLFRLRQKILTLQNENARLIKENEALKQGRVAEGLGKTPTSPSEKRFSSLEV